MTRPISSTSAASTPPAPSPATPSTTLLQAATAALRATKVASMSGSSNCSSWRWEDSSEGGTPSWRAAAWCRGLGAWVGGGTGEC